MIQKNFTTLLAFTLLLTAVAGSTGCKSGGGSRWAWNPWSKSVGQEAAALAESAPKLPSDGATPLIEGLESKQQAVVAAAKTPPAMKGLESTIEAVAAATPLIEKPAPSSPNWTPNPSAKSAAPTSTVAAATPAAQATPATAAAGGPYDPNGYQPAPKAQVASAKTDRYGLGDRYAAATAPVSSAPATKPSSRYGDLPTANSTPSSLGSRYGAPAATTPAAESIAAATPDVAPKAEPIVSPYPQANATAVASTAPQTPAYPTTTSTPSTPAVASTPTKSYPVTSANRYGAAPANSVYGAATTPIETTVASTPAASQGSVVRLTSTPGEYRPGGTSTYQTEVNVASRPEEKSSDSSATSRY